MANNEKLISDGDRFIRLKEIKALTTLSKTSIWARVARGEFPKPTLLGTRTAVWKASVIQDWMDKQVEAGRASNV